MSEEQRIFRKMVHDFADKGMAPLIKEWEQGGEFVDRDILSQYANVGLLGITLPEEYGGAGLSGSLDRVSGWIDRIWHG